MTMCESPLKTLENLKIEFCKVKYYFLGRAFAQFVEKSFGQPGPEQLHSLWVIADHAASNSVPVWAGSYLLC